MRARGPQSRTPRRLRALLVVCLLRNGQATTECGQRNSSFATSSWSDARDPRYADELVAHADVGGASDRVAISRRVSSSMLRAVYADATPTLLCRVGGVATPSQYDVAVSLPADGSPATIDLSSGAPWFCTAWGGALLGSLWLPMDGSVGRWAHNLSFTSEWCPLGRVGARCDVPLVAMTPTWADAIDGGVGARATGPALVAAVRLDRAAALVVLGVSAPARAGGASACVNVTAYVGVLPPDARAPPPPGAVVAPPRGLVGAWSLCAAPGAAAAWRLSLPQGATAWGALAPGTVFVSVTDASPGGGAPPVWVVNATAAPPALAAAQALGDVRLSPADATARFEPPRGTNYSLGAPPRGAVAHVIALPPHAPGFVLTLTLDVDVAAATAAGLTVVAAYDTQPGGDPSAAALDAVVLTLAPPPASTSVAARGADGGAGGALPPRRSPAPQPPVAVDPGGRWVSWELRRPPADRPLYFTVSAALPAAHAGPQRVDELTYRPHAVLAPCAAACAGDCVVTVDGPLLRGACACPQPQRWAGEDCDVRTASDAAYALDVAALAGSNAAAAAAAALAWRAGLGVELLVFLLTGVASGVYHSCDTGGWCPDAGYAALQAFDFASSYLSVLLVAVRLAGLPPAARHPLAVGMAGLLVYCMLEPARSHQTLTLDVAVPLTAAAVAGGLAWSVWANFATAAAVVASAAAAAAAPPRGDAAVDGKLGGAPPAAGGTAAAGAAAPTAAPPVPPWHDAGGEGGYAEWAVPLLDEHLGAGRGPHRPVGPGQGEAAARGGLVAVARATVDLLFRSGNFRWRALSGGLAVFGAALACKVLATNATYVALHSAWHVLSFAAAALLLTARDDFAAPLLVLGLFRSRGCGEPPPAEGDGALRAWVAARHVARHRGAFQVPTAG